MREFIIIASLLFFVTSYILYSRSVSTFINILTPRFILEVPLLYILEYAYLYYDNEPVASIEAYSYVYITYTLGNLVAVYVLMRIKVLQRFVLIPPPAYNICWLPYLMLSFAYLLYLPIIIEFKEYLLTPRMIYVFTRTGFGLQFFLSTTLAYLAFVLVLFKKSTFRFEKLIVFSFCMVLAFLHGSKGQVITLVFIWVLYVVYSAGLLVSFRRFFISAAIFAFGAMVLFYSFTVGIKPNQLLRLVSNYSDYSRNAMLVIDDDFPAQFGKLILEDNLWSRIPRILAPSKPKDFGSFMLSAHYFPEQFMNDAGVAAFGIGVIYADFKEFSVVYILFWVFLSTYLLKLFTKRVELYRHPADFIMLLFFAGICLVPIGVGYLALEHFLMALFIAVILKISVTLNVKPSLGKNISYSLTENRDV